MIDIIILLTPTSYTQNLPSLIPTYTFTVYYTKNPILSLPLDVSPWLVRWKHNLPSCVVDFPVTPTVVVDIILIYPPLLGYFTTSL